MVLSRLTKITGPGVATDTNWVGNNADFTGITTSATSFNIGVTTIHSTLIEAHNIKSTGIITATGGSFSGNVTAVDGTFSGNVSIAGTLTYEDVTNVDSVGIVTAAAVDVDDFLDVGSNIKLGNAGVITATSFVGSGAALTGIDATAVKDSGGNVKIQAQASGAMYTGIHTFSSGAEVGSNIKLGNAGVVTATSFTGSGANLTSLPAGQLTGTVPTARLGSGTANSSTFLRGDSTFAAVTSTTINSNTNNYLITGTGTANTLQGEANLTYNGNVLSLAGNDNQELRIGAGADLTLKADGSNSAIVHNGDGELAILAQGTSENIKVQSSGYLYFRTGGGNERLRITSDGKVGINQTGPTEDLEVKGDQTATIYINAGQHDASTANEATLKFGFNQSHGNDSIGYVKLLELGGNAYDGALTFGVPYNNSGTPATREALRIDSAGRIIRGHTGTYAVSGHYPALQLTGTTFNDATLGIINNANDSTGAYIQLSKQRSGSPTGATIVQDDDLVGQIGWTAGDGTDLTSRIAEIKGIVDGTPGSNDTPGRLSFWTTADGAQSTTERLRITSAGVIETGTAVGGSGYDSNMVFRIGRAGDCNLAIRNTANTTSHTGIDFGDSGDDRSGRIQYMHNGDYMSFHTNGAGSGTSNERLRIDSSGHMGLGVTPNTNWPTNADFKALQIGTGACVFGRGSGDEDRGGIAVNWYSTGSANKYIGNGNAARIYLADGNIYFTNAGANSSGANASMTLTDRLLINSSGRLKINHNQTPGQLDDTWLSIYDANSDSSANDPAGISKNYAMMAFHNYGTGSPGDAAGIGFGAGASFTYTKGSIAFTRSGSYGTGDLVFLTNNDQDTTLVNDTDEKLRITREGLIQAKTLSGSYYPIASVKDGSTSARAATSAWEIKKTLGPRAKTGYYYLKNPYDSSVNTWWCDMTTDGGGWILVAHVGDGGMSPLNTSDGNHWYNRSNKGGFDTVGSGYYKGGGYWRTSGGAWAENTCGQLMWDVRTHSVTYHDYAVSKVVFNWGTDQALPTGGSGYSNIPNANNRRFNEWCYEVIGAPGFDPANYHQNARNNVINGNNHFTEHMLMTWSFRGTGGGADDSDSPYWMIGSHHDGLHQHYEESLSGGDGVYGDGGYQVASNEDTGWGGGGANDGYQRIARHSDSGTCNIWLR